MNQPECVGQQEKHVVINESIEHLNMQIAQIYGLIERIKHGDHPPPCDPTAKEPTANIYSFDETLNSISSRVSDASAKVSGAVSELTAILF